MFSFGIIELICGRVCFVVFFFKQKTAYEMRISDWSSDVCSSGLRTAKGQEILHLLGNIDDEAWPHEYALTAKLARFFAQAWSKDADRYWLAVDVMGYTFYGPFVQTAYTGRFVFNELRAALSAFEFKRDTDADRYLALLSDTTHFLRQIHERTSGQAERGIRIHKQQLPGARKLVTDLREAAATSYPVKAERLAEIGRASGRERVCQYV